MEVHFKPDVQAKLDQMARTNWSGAHARNARSSLWRLGNSRFGRNIRLRNSPTWLDSSAGRPPGRKKKSKHPRLTIPN